MAVVSPFKKEECVHALAFVYGRGPLAPPGPADQGGAQGSPLEMGAAHVDPKQQIHTDMDPKGMDNKVPIHGARHWIPVPRPWRAVEEREDDPPELGYVSPAGPPFPKFGARAVVAGCTPRPQSRRRKPGPQSSLISPLLIANGH